MNKQTKEKEHKPYIEVLLEQKLQEGISLGEERATERIKKIIDKWGNKWLGSFVSVGNIEDLKRRLNKTAQEIK